MQRHGVSRGGCCSDPAHLDVDTCERVAIPTSSASATRPRRRVCALRSSPYAICLAGNWSLRP